jgi:hypothetical protein
MTEPDDDVPIGVDMTAWQAPPLPKNLADGVLARMHGGVVHEPIDRPRRKWMMAGFAATVAAAVAVWALARRGGERGATVAGVIRAERAQHLDLGDVVAEVEAGAEIQWQRSGAQLHVEQHAGTATWTVRGDETLVIDAGAKLASIEATGASLRVEVPMNLSDRVVLGSAATSAVVAALTVLVYEGRVHATHDGQTVVVAAGAPYQVPVQPPAPPTPTLPPTTTDSDVRIKAGESVVIHDIDAPMVTVDSPCHANVLFVRTETITPYNYTPSQRVPPDKMSMAIDPGHTSYEVTCGTTHYTGTIDVIPDDDGYTRNDNLGGFQITEPARDVSWPDPVRVSGSAGPRAGTVTVDGKVLATGSPISMSGVSIPTDAQVFTTSVAGPRTVIAVRLDHPTAGIHIFMLRPLHFVATLDAPPHCDASPLIDQGKTQFARGMYKAALTSFETALRCKADPDVSRFAAMAACKVGAADKARRYFVEAADNAQRAIEQACATNHITLGRKDYGTLEISSLPEAKVVIDDVDTGRTTPIAAYNALKLLPGKHKLTLVVGAERHSYDFVVEPGGTLKMSKSLK